MEEEQKSYAKSSVWTSKDVTSVKREEKWPLEYTSAN